MAGAAAVLTHAILLATLSRSPPLPVPLPAEEAGVPLVLQSVQPLGAATLATPSSRTPQLASPAGLTIVAGHAPSPPATPRRSERAAHHAPGRVPAAGPAPQLVRQSIAAAAAPAPPSDAAKPDAGAAKAGAAKAGRDGNALLPALEARIDEAVRQAAVMPEAARRQRREGRARVKFTYVDGRVDGVALVAPSQSRLLDDAALQAVSRAAYPQPPAGLRGRHLDLLVWVNFRMEA